MEEFSLYGGKVTLQFDDIKHRYWVIEENGDRFPIPSITTVLGVIDKPQLIQWAVNCALDHLRSRLTDGEFSIEDIDRFLDEAKYAHRNRVQEAAEIGTEAHKWLESYWIAKMQGEGVPELPLHEQVRNCAEAGVKWIEEHEIEPLIIEKPLYSRQNRVAGRMDKLAKIDGRLAVVDWKSSTGLWPNYILQTSAYAKMYEEETGEVVEERWLVRLGKYDGAFEAKCFQGNCNADYAAFLAALTLQNRLKELK